MNAYVTVVFTTCNHVHTLRWMKKEIVNYETLLISFERRKTFVAYSYE